MCIIIHMNNKNYTPYDTLDAILLARKDTGDKTATNSLSLLATLKASGLFTTSNFHLTVANRQDFIKQCELWLKQNRRRSLSTHRSRLKYILKLYDTEVLTRTLSFTDLLEHSFLVHFGPFKTDKSRHGGIFKTDACKKVAHSFLDQGLRLQSNSPDETLEHAIDRSIKQTLRWLKGSSLPAQQFRPSYTNALDVFFGHPVGTFENALPPKSSTNTNLEHENQPIHRSKRKNVPLPVLVQNQFDVFSALKIMGKRPKTLNFLPHEQPGESATRVRDVSRKGPWTRNAEGRCSTAGHALSVVRGYFSFLQNDCSDATWSSPNELSLAHLADVEALEAYVDACLERNWPTLTVENLLGLLDQIRRPSGYLHRGVRPLAGFSVERWFSHLDNLTDTIAVLEDVLERSPNKITLGAVKRVTFLTSESPEKAHSLLNDLNNLMVTESSDTSNNQKKQYEFLTTALILQLSRVSPLRRANWPRLNYFEGPVSEIPREQSSLARDARSGSFRLYVPIDHLKNRNRPDIVPIDTPIPKRHVNQIEQYLDMRNQFMPTNPQNIHSAGNPLFLRNDAYEYRDIERATEVQIARWFQRRTKDAVNDLLPHLTHNGINMHGLRHLVATLFLNDNPGNYAALATLLNDSLEVVLARYAKVNHKHQSEFICAWADKCAEG